MCADSLLWERGLDGSACVYSAGSGVVGRRGGHRRGGVTPCCPWRCGAPRQRCRWPPGTVDHVHLSIAFCAGRGPQVVGISLHRVAQAQYGNERREARERHHDD